MGSERVVGLAVQARRPSSRRHLGAVVDGRHACELLSKEWVVSCCLGVDSGHTRTSAVDKCAGGCVLGGDTEVTCVAKGVHTVTGSEQRVESGLVLVHLLLRGVERRLCLGEAVLLLQLGLAAKGIEGLLLRERAQGRNGVGSGRLWAAELGKRVVGSSWGGLQRLSLVVSCPGIVAAGLESGLRGSW